MYHKKRLIILTVFLLFAAPALTAVDIEVRVLNGTAGADDPTGLPVTLLIGGEEPQTAPDPSATDKSGSAKFAAVPVQEGAEVTAKVGYQGVVYESEPAPVPTGPAQLVIDLPVYETTSTQEEIAVSFHHTVLRPLRGALEVNEMFVIDNRGDRTYTGGEEIEPGVRQVFQYSLPPGYTDLQLGKGMMACCIIQQEGGLIDTMDLKPGQRMVQYRYLVPATTSEMVFKPSFPSKTEHYSMLVHPALEVQAAAGLQPAGSAGEGADAFVKYEANDLDAGELASVRLAGLPVETSYQMEWWAVGAALLLVGGLTLWTIRSPRKHGCCST